MTAGPHALALVEALLSSHQLYLGEPLVPRALARREALVEAAAWLYERAEFALLAHDTGPDPAFIYANLEAQRQFERSWAELVGMPSRLSAEAPDREERAAMLAEVARSGFTRGYRGLRVARSGRRFWIEDGVVWNIRAPSGELLGQAARFQRPSAATVSATPP